jgi:hypothetical protein
MTSQNVWNMSLFEHCFKVLSLYLDDRIRIRIKMKGRIRIRISIKVTSRIQIRNCTKWQAGCGSATLTVTKPYYIETVLAKEWSMQILMQSKAWVGRYPKWCWIAMCKINLWWVVEKGGRGGGCKRGWGVRGRPMWTIEQVMMPYFERSATYSFG